eukprot:TRINITY_DN15652_c0_g2_i1.p1 TRINITY_DN15652_c0_g2~~TRINITY_DN15652_c0_g2_i1.p1  ORF type:complete len:266 (-),score=-8.17 TRINITY_DN15652_c0_g2_i1:23-820(-)
MSNAHIWAPVALCIVQLTLTWVALASFSNGVVDSTFYYTDADITGTLSAALLCIGIPRWFTLANLVFNFIRCCAPHIQKTAPVRNFQILLNAALFVSVLVGAILLSVSTSHYCNGDCGSLIAGDVLAFLAALSYIGAAVFWYRLVPEPYVPPPPQPQATPYGAQGYPPHGYPPSGYPAGGYAASGYPPAGYPPAGYPPAPGYPPAGYPPAPGYPATGYPAASYPAGSHPPPPASNPPGGANLPAGQTPPAPAPPSDKPSTSSSQV